MVLKLLVLVFLPAKVLFLIDFLLSVLVSAGSTESFKTVAYASIDGVPASQTSLDLYQCRPDATQLVLYVHGGGWTRGDKQNVFAMPGLFNQGELCFGSVNYPLVSGNDKTTIIDQQLSALHLFDKWIDEFEEKRDDPRTISIIAHSSGAHLVALFDKVYGWSHSVKNLILLDSAAYNLKDRYFSAPPRFINAVDIAVGATGENDIFEDKLRRLGKFSPALLKPKARNGELLRLLVLTSLRPAKIKSAFQLAESYSGKSEYAAEVKELNFSHQMFIRAIGTKKNYSTMLIDWISNP